MCTLVFCFFTCALTQPIFSKQTNKSLRLLANLDLVWCCALLRWRPLNQSDFPLITPPVLDLTLAATSFGEGPMFSGDYGGLETSLLSPSSSPACFTWVYPTMEGDAGRVHTSVTQYEGSQLSHREIYWNTLRIQHTLMKQPRPVMELFASLSLEVMGLQVKPQ
ncbi:hypothetical protein DL93DRAFT_2082627 [Clavulina sp. PMI_390]|nr:hypothetical protein DL93DRAFT_2082627 [Clavulina sp. PMI_390]